MRIAVFGTGGVGGYFGGRLAQSGEQVVFIARGEHLRSIQANGLRVDSLKGDFVLHPAQATDDPSQVGAVDVILVAVKAWQVPAAARAMQPMVAEHTFIVPLENGVDAPGQLAEALGEAHVLGGLCRISAFIAGPGHIRHVGIEPYVAFGELNRRPSQRAENLRLAFERAGVVVEIVEDVHVAMWSKFLFIAAISGVGAVARAPAGVIRSIPETRQLLVSAMEEIYNLGRNRGVDLPADSVAQTMAFIDGMAPEVTASMQRDIIAGQPSELESQNGAVVRMGVESGVSTPVNAFLYGSLLPQEQRARGEVQF